MTPSALAVFKLMTNSNVVGCSTGKSAGLRNTMETGIKEGMCLMDNTVFGLWQEGRIPAAVALAFCIYLPIVVKRSAVQGFGDVQVFFRAGWAVWTGYPLYEVADHHGWTYHYPPTFALLMGLFANPVDGYPQPAWALPLTRLPCPVTAPPMRTSVLPSNTPMP